MFYILSIKWTRKGDKWVTFWRSNCAGYVWALASAGRSVAGRYEEAEVLADLAYFNDGENSIAVPCAAADALSAWIPQGEQDYPDAYGVRFTKENMQRLRDASPFPITVRV
jgi:hypothetical protein